MEKFDEYLGKARELAEDAGDMAASFTLGAKEKVQVFFKDSRAGNEIRQGIKELEDLPEFDGSILYKMELESTINDLNGLLLIINDKRIDDASVLEEVKKVKNKVQPPAEPQAEDGFQLSADPHSDAGSQTCENSQTDSEFQINAGPRTCENSQIDAGPRTCENSQADDVSQTDDNKLHLSDEDLAIGKVKMIAYNACAKALEALNIKQ